MTDRVLVNAVADAVVERIDPRIERMERAILGDDNIGHVGLVERVRELEKSKSAVDGIHASMDSRREDGDQKLHERVNRLERKLDRFLWVAAGVGLGSGAGGAWLAQFLT